jgi:hypothetical protein
VNLVLLQIAGGSIPWCDSQDYSLDPELHRLQERTYTTAGIVAPMEDRQRAVIQYSTPTGGQRQRNTHSHTAVKAPAQDRGMRSGPGDLPQNRVNEFYKKQLIAPWT